MTTTVCVDAGIVIKQVTDADDVGVHALWDEWFENDVRIVAPGILYYEVTNVLHRYQLHHGLEAAVVQAVLAAALSLPIRITHDTKLHQDAIDAARRFELPAAYDAHYLALAERERAVLWTTDERLRRKTLEKGADFVRCPIRSDDP